MVLGVSILKHFKVFIISSREVLQYFANNWDSNQTALQEQSGIGLLNSFFIYLG